MLPIVNCCPACFNNWIHIVKDFRKNLPFLRNIRTRTFPQTLQLFLKNLEMVKNFQITVCMSSRRITLFQDITKPVTAYNWRKNSNAPWSYLQQGRLLYYYVFSYKMPQNLFLILPILLYFALYDLMLWSRSVWKYADIDQLNNVLPTTLDNYSSFIKLIGNSFVQNKSNEYLILILRRN